MIRNSGRTLALSIDALQVLGALAREAIERLEVLDGQAEEVAACLDQAALEQLGEDLPAGALDIHRAAADEMLELLADASRAQGRFGQ